MKTRIIYASAALALLCGLIYFSPPIFRHHTRSGTGGLRASTNTSTLRSFHYVREEWMGNARTAAAALRYLLEREPSETNTTLIASNATKKVPPGPSCLRARNASADSERLPCGICKDLAVTQTTGRESFVHLRAERIFPVSPVDPPPGLRFSDSRLASQAAEGTGDEFDSMSRRDDSKSVQIVMPQDTDGTNSQRALNEPGAVNNPGDGPV
jgi:hypothetical protein